MQDFTRFSDVICKVSHVFFFHLTVLQVQNYVFHYFPVIFETLDSSKFDRKGGRNFMCPVELPYFSLTSSLISLNLNIPDHANSFINFRCIPQNRYDAWK